MSPRLLARPRLIADESPAGFLLRASSGNGWPGPLGFLSCHLSRPVNLNALRARVADPARFSDTVGRLGLSAQSAAAPFRHFPVSRDALRFPVTAVCPRCLAEEAYLRRAWDSALVNVCARHGHLLVDRCPACLMPLTLLRGETARCDCGFDLRAVIPERAPTQSARCLESLARSRPAAIRLIERVFALLGGHLRTDLGRDRIDVLDLAALAWWAPEGLADFLSDWCWNHSARDGEAPVHPRVCFHAWLGDDEDRVREPAVRALSHLEELGAPRGLGSRCRPPEVGVTLRQAARILGLSPPLVLGLIRSGLIPASPSAPGSRCAG